ncbi:hypothetical protein SDC9_64914 [bioreactor metagenome]|uniref:SIR2-like domain-containing protein n=1 Tax=bioreactor metagenome TaxID=1076179 RepID=A0A644XQK0_9ZZZZ
MEIPSKLISAIEQDKLVIFAGSGLSTRFNLPNWKKLVIDVINEIDASPYQNYIPLLEMEDGGMSPIEVLNKLKKEHQIIRSYIKNKFNIEEGDFSLHKNILELTKFIVTTNYDNAFEIASENKIIPAMYTSEFNISEVEKNSEPYILKIHGSFSEPDRCILFSEDYENFYHESDKAAVEKLKSIFINKTILFLGFSFNDPEINLIFGQLDKFFRNFNKHYILATESDKFDDYKFLDVISISNYTEIDTFIKECLKEKKSSIDKSKSSLHPEVQKINAKLNIAYLYPQCLDIDLKDLSQVINNFDSIDATFYIGALNKKTLLQIEDFDLLIIVSKTYKSRLYIEEDNLKSKLVSAEEICETIPNYSIPIVFITNGKIDLVDNYPAIYISSLKNSILKRFVYKAIKNNDLNFTGMNEISIHLYDFINKKLGTENFVTTSIYKNNRALDIGKKCLTDVVGRIEEQASIIQRILNMIDTNRLLNIKASGGIGKTTIIKKIAYELYNRGYFKEGVNFKSCESIKSYDDFEDLLIEAFNLRNILNFKEHLIENYISNKIDILIILDNFETVVNQLNEQDLSEVISLLKFATDYAYIIVTSRERISDEDFEDVYTLTPMITDDALALFQKLYGEVKNPRELKILRSDILEDLLNNNPLAIKLVTKSRVRFSHINELKDQLTNHFFESTNEDYSDIFENYADLNIERTKSIYQSINYSYSTLSSKERTAFDLLSLFPDGISLTNFKKCFKESDSVNKISDKELRILKDKSLIEDYNGILQLQPIIRRFANFQFLKRPQVEKQKYCLDAYIFNCFILEIIVLIDRKKSFSESLEFFSNFKNNLLNVLDYIPDIKIEPKGLVSEKEYLLNFIYSLSNYLTNEKLLNLFIENISNLKPYFSTIPDAEKFINVLHHRKVYYYQEFNDSYKKLTEYLSVEEMEERIIKEEKFIETRYKNLISSIHAMEGYTLQLIKSLIQNNYTDRYINSDLFYLGIPYNIASKKKSFYDFEYELMFNQLDVNELKKYISNLHMEQHLEIMQCTYTLSKVEKLDDRTIKKLVITNPYTKGLKELMFAFNAQTNEEKNNHFKLALKNLFHIKYYYLEALYYYYPLAELII